MKKDAGNKCRRNGLLSSAACLSVLLLALLLASPLVSAAAGTEWEVAPSNPYVGDTLVITGTSADQTLDAKISFEKSVSVYGGEYEYTIDKVKIPAADNNHFTVRAEGVKDLNLRVKKLLWGNFAADAVDGVATISQSHVPPLTYKVQMDGDALDGQSRVTLRITAAQTIDTDSEGNLRFEYDTDGMPAGEYDITIERVTKTITLKAKSSSGGSSGTGSVTIRSAEPEEPEIPEEVVEEGNEEEESGEDASKALENETEEEQPESEPATEETPEEEEPSADGSFMVWGILGSLLVISLIRKSGK